MLIACLSGATRGRPNRSPDSGRGYTPGIPPCSRLYEAASRFWSAPQGATLLGTTAVVQVGFVVLTISRGTGPTKQTFWTGYWSAAGS